MKVIEKFLSWCRRTFWRHHWQPAYPGDRNPYRRRCGVCKRYEVSHCRPWNWDASWWEVFNEGDPSLHWKKQ